MAPAPKLAERYTWADYLSWPEDVRFEILNGDAFAMVPPTTWHQEISDNLVALFRERLRGKPCRAYSSPIGVKLSDADAFEPDLAVVCDRDQMQGSHIEGAPSLIIEILSPSTEAYDRHTKLPRYAHFSVQEVWFIRPHPAIVEVFWLDGETYRVAGIFRPPEILKSPGFPDLELPLEAVFDFWTPPPELGQ
ncbi:MAG: Uma2 family endonuclease [Rhodothermales bacterium]|jgi:Uma2 family endonuclease